MNTKAIPKAYKLSSGYTLPSIGLGTYDLPSNATSEIVYEALKCGYRHLDTAVLYGNEREVGEGILKWLKENPSSNKREDAVSYTHLDVYKRQ